MICKGFLTKAKKHRFAVHDGAYFPLFTGFPGGGTAFTLNVVPPPGNSNTGGSTCLPVGGQNLQLALHHVKILTPGVPMLLNLHGCQAQHTLRSINIIKLSLFFVICRNGRFRPLIIFVQLFPCLVQRGGSIDSPQVRNCLLDVLLDGIFDC